MFARERLSHSITPDKGDLTVRLTPNYHTPSVNEQTTCLRHVLERAELALEGLGGEEPQLEGHDGGRDAVHLFI